MRGNVVKEIDKETYEIWHLPAELAITTLTKLTRIIGEPMGKAMGGLESSSGSLMDANVNFNIIGHAIGLLASRLDENEVMLIIKTMLKYVHKKESNGKLRECDLELDFQGRIMHLFKVVQASLEFNYSDFFAGIKSRLKEVFPAISNPNSAESSGEQK